jgi:transmembrane sensor
VGIQKFLDLIEKYKRGECSPEEKELLEDYLESFQDNPNVWIKDEMGDQAKVDEKIYSEIMKNINKEKNHYFTKAFLSPSLLKIAASIIFLMIIASGILYKSGIFEHNASSLVWYEKVTSSGEKSIITFSDGSIVTLNADSKLKYPVQFDEVKREVHLEGEAFFEVHHDTSHPFIVHSENLSTTVLGTTFDVSAYQENKTIVVSLLGGKVKVLKDGKEKEDEIAILKPREQLLYNKEKNLSSFGKFDSLEVVGWKDNIYKFENDPLGKVLPQLERAFGVKFSFIDKSVLSQKITTKFEKKSLNTVAEVIKNLTGLDYKIDNGNDGIKEVLFFKDK